MVEEGSGKGIQFAEGTFNITIVNNYNYDIVIDTNLDFNPTLLFLTCGPNVICSNIHNSQNNMLYFGGDTSAVYIYSFDSSSIILRGMTYRDAYNVSRTGTWYAIGVGKEDTTLRDSLASILQEEGIIITEDDDMASLISKVDEEFTKDNNTINSLTNELAGKVTPAGTAVASNVLTGKTFINSTGQTITGTMANNGTKTITPKASAQTLGAGYYDKITINGDADLVAANIVSGKNIFGVTGTASTLKSSSNFNYAFFTSYNTTIYINGGASDTKQGQNYLITSFTNNAGDCNIRISGLTVHVSQYYNMAYTVEYVRNGSVVYTSTIDTVGSTKFSTDYDVLKKGDVLNFYIKSKSSSAKNSGVKDLMILGSLSV
jgi:hypothetical protein